MKVIVSSEALLENVEEWVHERGGHRRLPPLIGSRKGLLLVEIAHALNFSVVTGGIPPFFHAQVEESQLESMGVMSHPIIRDQQHSELAIYDEMGKTKVVYV